MNLRDLDVEEINDSGIYSDTSEIVTAGIKWWLRNCAENHDECHSSREPPNWQPTRILDLGDPAEPLSPRLLRGDQVPEGVEYVTLSHCWGTSQPLKLQSSNIHQLSTSIPTSSLPKTFLDATVIARNLSQRYLWIDSLCIIQDSQSDWAQESSRMGSIYGNAIFNIAATALSHCQGGCYCLGDLS